MILADKILKLRKENGWSQEDLADKLKVSRQAISKWEGAQSTPDLDRIIQMSNIFGVSTDYLLKDDIEDLDAFQDYSDQSYENLRKISMEEANEFLELNKLSSGLIARAISLCILSPVALLILIGASESGYGISENLAVALGVSIVLFFIGLAVFIFVRYGSQLEEYDYLEKEKIETAYGVKGLVEERKKSFKPLYQKKLALGIALCIIGAVPVIVGSMFGDGQALALMVAVAISLMIVALGVNLIVKNSIIWDGFNKLLEEEDYRRDNKSKNSVLEPLRGIYWLSILAAYLGYSLLTNRWDISWIIWPVAGILFGVISILVEFFVSKEE